MLSHYYQYINPSIFSLVYTGPLLLNAFLRYLRAAAKRRENDHHLRPDYAGASSFWEVSSWVPHSDSLAFGCGCVALLGLAAVLKASILLHSCVTK